LKYMEKTMELNFSKLEGLGNDFIILNDLDGKIRNRTTYGNLAKKLCDRHFSIGADGIIIVSPSNTLDFRFRIFNPDGSEPQMCGNGMRCFAQYLFEKKLTDKTTIQVETLAGTIIPEIINFMPGKDAVVKVDMGEPVLEPSKIPFASSNQRAVMEPIQVNGTEIPVTAVSMGNPHAVIFVEDVTRVDLKKRGRAVENHPLFPEKTNVEFVQVVNPEELIMRVWERGAGETLACGTGACAALVAASLNKKSSRRAHIRLAGGSLTIEWNLKDNHLYKTGPACLAFEGVINI